MKAIIIPKTVIWENNLNVYTCIKMFSYMVKMIKTLCIDIFKVTLLLPPY